MATLTSTHALQDLLSSRQIWQGQGVPLQQGLATGLAALDAVLPLGGWPPAALTEILLPAMGCGEWTLLQPALARLSRAQQRVVLVAPPAIVFAPAWQAGGIRLDWLEIVDAADDEALWAMEQCLRAGCCAAVLAWPRKADYAALRRLQVAADTGQSLGIVLRPSAQASQASPAALRLEIGAQRTLWVRKCRGGSVPEQSFALS